MRTRADPRSPPILSTTGLPHLRLLQLVSPTLPIGMYSYSQGQEKAVEDGWLADEVSVAKWLEGLPEYCIARTDVPILARLYDAWTVEDDAQVARWSAYLCACRETEELRIEDRQTGQTLARVLGGLGIAQANAWLYRPNASFATLFAMAGVSWHIPRSDLLAGYCWGWLENQVLSAVKVVLLGQAAGQRLLAEVSECIPSAVEAGLLLDDDAIGGSSPLLAIVSGRHQIQYSRLFRS